MPTKPNINDLNEELQSLKADLNNTMSALHKKLDSLPNKEDLSALETKLTSTTDVVEAIREVLNSKEFESKIQEKIDKYTAPILESMDKRIKQLEAYTKKNDLRNCSTLLVLNGMKIGNDTPINTLYHYLPSGFRDITCRARFIGNERKRKMLVEFPTPYHRKDFQRQLRMEKIGLTLGINASEFIPESFETERRGLSKLGMELKKTKKIASFEIINGMTDIFLGVSLTVNKKRVYDKTTGPSIEATINSFHPPLDQLYGKEKE